MIAIAQTTALLLDASSGAVRLVQYDGQLETLRELLRVKYVDCLQFDDFNVVFVDEEQFGHTTGFVLEYKGNTATFGGSALITGDDEGQNAPVDIVMSELKIEFVKLK